MTEDHSFNYRESSAFDFANAPLYRKKTTLDQGNLRIATAAEEVITTIKGAEETRNTAQVGDRIITGVQGEQYVLTKEKFEDLYERDPNNSSCFISTNVIRAMQLVENTELTAPWGEKQRAAKGGFVAQRVDDPSDIYLIEEGAFKATYAPEVVVHAFEGVRDEFGVLPLGDGRGER